MNLLRILKQQQQWVILSFQIIKENGLYYFLIHGDFTPVCTTEFIAFSKAFTYFEKLNTSLMGLSIDSNSSHLSWLYDIYLKTGIKVPFPVIADRSRRNSKKIWNDCK